MKVVVNGANGKMGRLTVEEFSAAGHEVVARVDNAGGDCIGSIADFTGEADVVVDFSFHTAAKDVCDFAVKRGVPAVIATTGHTAEEKELIIAAAKKIPVFYSGNMSIGIALLMDFAKKAAAVFGDADVEIMEIHHNRKADAPSGTALMLAEAVGSSREGAEIVSGRSGSKKREKNEIGIASLRLANVVGIHEVYISTPNETITLKHEAHDRRLFASGAVKAAEFVLNKSAGLYDVRSMKF